MSVKQVDDGRSLVKTADRSVLLIYRLTLCIHVVPHAQTIVTTGTEHLHLAEGLHSIRNINKHIAAVLCLVIVSVARITSTTTEDSLKGVLCMILRTDIYKRAVLLRHGSVITIEQGVCVVVSTVAASEDGIDTTLQVLHIR